MVQSEFERVAAAFHDCLRTAGLPVRLAADSSGRRTLVDFSVEDFFWSRPDGQMEAGAGYPPAQVDAFMRRVDQAFHEAGPEEFGAADSGADAAAPTRWPGFDYRLEVDGVDHSDTFRRCVEATGYDQRAVFASLPRGGADPAWLEAALDAAVEWAACARAAGFVRVKDAVRPVADVDPEPTVLLPADLTEVELVHLLTVCPTWTPEREEANRRARAEWAGAPTRIPGR
jgi:hypothetical protein